MRSSLNTEVSIRSMDNGDELRSLSLSLSPKEICIAFNKIVGLQTRFEAMIWVTEEMYRWYENQINSKVRSGLYE